MPPEPRSSVPLDPLPASADRALCEAKVNFEKLLLAEPLRHVHHDEILRHGPVEELVLDTIEREKIDLVVLGTHGRTGIKKIVLGSVAEKIFRTATCPVLTVGPFAGSSKQIHRVLFATDFGPASLRALPYAIDFANKNNGELILFHLVPPFPVDYVGPFWYPGTDLIERETEVRQSSLEKLRQLLPSNSGLRCAVDHVAEIHLAPEGITAFARQRDVDLIVMGLEKAGTDVPRLSAHMPWATAYQVVCNSDCPVLTVRA
jgi:nucleotide-binding universal stress UspA family protein